MTDHPKHSVVCSTSGKWRLAKGEAKSEAKRQERGHGRPFTAYKCWHCGGWHIASVRSKS